MSRTWRVFVVWTLGLTMLLGVAGLVVPQTSIAEPNTGHGPQKTDKQCKDDQAKCNKACDQLIDIDNNIQRCKDRCTDTYIICTPALSSGQPGSTLGGVRPPVLPGVVEPMKPTGKISPYSKPGIMRRGVEGEAAGSSSTGTEEKAPATK